MDAGPYRSSHCNSKDHMIEHLLEAFAMPALYLIRL